MQKRVAHLQPDGFLDVDGFGGLEVHVQAIFGPRGDDALGQGHGEVVAQVLQAGDPPGHWQRQGVAEEDDLGFFPAGPKEAVLVYSDF